MHSKAQERNNLFKTIWALSDQNPVLSIDANISITDYKSLCNVEVKRFEQDNFSVTVQVTENENSRTFTKTELSFLEAFSIVNRICTYHDHKVLHQLDLLSENEPGHLFCDNGPLSIHGIDAFPRNKGDWEEVL